LEEGKNKMNIREADINDTVGLTKMYRKLYDEEFSPDSLIPIDNHNFISKIFIAQEKNEKIGFIWINFIEYGESKYGYIEDLYVEPLFRNKGHGTMLVEKAKNFFLEKSAMAVFVSLKGKNNYIVKFYNKQEFNECEGLWFHFAKKN
jgi:ribosomal protein S18 acetylase RimI-like enzyme